MFWCQQSACKFRSSSYMALSAALNFINDFTSCVLHFLLIDFFTWLYFPFCMLHRFPFFPFYVTFIFASNALCVSLIVKWGISFEEWRYNWRKTTCNWTKVHNFLWFSSSLFMHSFSCTTFYCLQAPACPYTITTTSVTKEFTEFSHTNVITRVRLVGLRHTTSYFIPFVEFCIPRLISQISE